MGAKAPFFLWAFRNFELKFITEADVSCDGNQQIWIVSDRQIHTAPFIFFIADQGVLLVGHADPEFHGTAVKGIVQYGITVILSFKMDA